MKPQEFINVTNTNLNGTFFCSQAAFKGSMMKLKSGRIINIASVVAQLGSSSQANYAASKGGIISLTRSHAREFSSRNVCVNAVCPGYIHTDMTSPLLSQDPNLCDRIPLKRFGTPEEVAGLVKYLALDKSSEYITGHCFNIDGGLAIGAT
jgi:3-oxoacyl-[acyl-carrier protein] reductase